MKVGARLNLTPTYKLNYNIDSLICNMCNEINSVI